MSRRPFFSLRLRLAVAFGLFVLLGSCGLVGWLHLSARQEALLHFAELARANASFVRDARLPVTPRTAEGLSRVLGFEVVFSREGETAPELNLVPKAEERAELLRRSATAVGMPIRWMGIEAMLIPVHEGARMWFVRASEPGLSILLHPQILAVVGVFWLLALALAAALGRGIINPLRALAKRLPQIEHDPVATLSEAQRNDEIGQLARAYLETREQLAEERVQREKAERLALLGRMATGLAHEIHNPVSAIRMHGQLLQSTPESEFAAVARETLPVLLTETARIESLVNQWMFLARPEPPRKSRTDLRVLVDSVVAALLPNARHAGVEFVNQLTGELFVEGDGRRLAQAVSNVVLNAIQSMPDGGALTIAGGTEQGMVVLSFRDDGIGFSPEALARHSELFFSEKEGGMGMGLSVTAEVIKAHGGRLSVENAQPVGAVVTIRIPAAT